MKHRSCSRRECQEGGAWFDIMGNNAEPKERQLSDIDAPYVQLNQRFSTDRGSSRIFEPGILRNITQE
jgi:hypothetical protein